MFICVLFYFHILQILLVISHGNASVESGFSINEDLLVENMKERTIVAQRVVYDAIKQRGGCLSVSITAEMMEKFRLGHVNYRFYLEEERKKQESTHAVAEERKRSLVELKEKEAKRRRLQEELEQQGRDIAYLKDKIHKS